MARDLALERAWRDRQRQYERSGVTIREFCERESLSAAQFTWWRGELKRRGVKAAPGKAKGTGKRPTRRIKERRRRTAAARADFLRVDVNRSSVGQPSIEIVLDRPVRIAIGPGFDAQLLAQVVRVLENDRC
jgi:hypothetical protein